MSESLVPEKKTIQERGSSTKPKKQKTSIELAKCIHEGDIHISKGVDRLTYFGFPGPCHILFKTSVMETSKLIQKGVKPK